MERIFSFKKIAVISLVFIAWLFVYQDLNFARQDEDVLLKARRLYQQGYYDDAIKLLNKYIEKIKTVAEQKRNVAKAFYQLAKVYFTVGEDNKVEENLNKVFKNYPDFQTEETDLEFRDRVEKAKVKVKAKVKAKKEEKPAKKPEPEIVKKKTVTKKAVKKERKKAAFGVKAAAGLTHVAGDISFHFELGGSVMIPLSQKISLVPELYYYNNPNESFSHIKIPLLLLFNFNRVVGVQVGGYIALPMSYDGWGDLSSYFGGNLGINLKIKKMTLELRYYLPFSSGYQGWDHYFHSLSFIVGFYF